MDSLLENELVRKNFGCGNFDGPFTHGDNHRCNPEMAYRVLISMQEPIRKGERFLHLFNETWIENQFKPDADELTNWHPEKLRLPSRFQPSSDKKECGHWPVANATSYECVDCGERVSRTQPPPTPGYRCTCPVHDSCLKCGKECHKPATSGKCECDTPGEYCLYCGPPNHAPDPATRSLAPEIEAKSRILCADIAAHLENSEFGMFEVKLHRLFELARRSDR